MFKKESIINLIKEKFNHYFSDLSDKEEKFSKAEERKLVIEDKYWSNVCQKSKLNNIHITAKQKNNIAI